jgi:hypothetical protein
MHHAAREQVVRDQERWRHDERKKIKRDEAIANLKLPPQRDSYTLSSYLADEKPPRIARIDQLQYEGHKTIVLAQHKVGKSKTSANIARSLADGEPFLGEFEVKPTEGRIGIWNLEMDDRDYEDYLTETGIGAKDRVALWHLQGYGLPLLVDEGFEAALQWVNENEITYLIIDQWAKLCFKSNVNENYAHEVGPLLERLDELVELSSIGELFIPHHAGWVDGRARGSTALPAWADSIWTLTAKQLADGERGQRHMRAEGRGIDVGSFAVDLEDGLLTYRPMSKKQSDVLRLSEEFAQIVADDPGIAKTEAREQIPCRDADKTAVMKLAVENGLVCEERDPSHKQRILLFPGEPTV